MDDIMNISFFFQGCKLVCHMAFTFVFINPCGSCEHGAMRSVPPYNKEIAAKMDYGTLRDARCRNSTQ